jgi:hypothetical protein
MKKISNSETKLVKIFHIGAIVSVTTGIFACKDGIGELYKILDFLTQDTLFTHQLPRASDECRPWLKKWLPWLDEINTNITEENHKEWLVNIENKYGKYFALEPIPYNKHKKIDPIKELVSKVGKDKVIPIILGDNK